MNAPANPTPARLTIDIWSDVMCPWCVIGYKQLEQALDGLAGEIEADVRWHPFELNPDLPSEGEDAASHMLRKYGRAPDATSMGRMEAMAAEAGYDIRYHGEGEEPPRMLWNTFLAHKLLRWALTEHGAEAQSRLKLALFDAHFQQRRNVSDATVLADVAASAGIDHTAAEAALADEELGRTVRTEEREARAMEINAVPAMLINSRYMIPGAQGVETYTQLLRKVVARDG